MIHSFNDFGFCLPPSEVNPIAGELGCFSKSAKPLLATKSLVTVGITTLLTAPISTVNQAQIEGIKEGKKDSIFTIVKTRSLPHLYKGGAVNFVGSIPKHLLRCAAVGYVDRALEAKVESKVSRAMISGLSGGVAEAAISAPFASLSVHLRAKDNPSLKEAFERIPGEGLKKIPNLFRGTIATAARNGVYYAAYTPAAEWIYEMLSPHLDEKMAVGCGLASGALAGMASVFVSYPINMVTVVQRAENLSFPKAFALVMKREGVRGFFRGATTALPIMGISMMVYSGVEAFFAKKSEPLN